MARLNRRLLIANAQIVPTPSYVTDGLILHLDGIDWGNQSGKWIDLINGVEFLATGSVNYNNNCFVFSGGRFDSSTKFEFKTIEIACSPSSGFLFNNQTYLRSVWITNNGFQFSGYSGGAVRIPFVQNQLQTLSATIEDNYYSNGKVYVNGIEKTERLETYNTNANLNGTRIGNNVYGNSPFSGDICSVRLYNRSLTAAEIAQNFAVDKQRFGIT